MTTSTMTNNLLNILQEFGHPEDLLQEGEAKLVAVYTNVMAAHATISKTVTKACENRRYTIPAGILERETALDSWLSIADGYLPDWFVADLQTIQEQLYV